MTVDTFRREYSWSSSVRGNPPIPVLFNCIPDAHDTLEEWREHFTRDATQWVDPDGVRQPVVLGDPPIPFTDGAAVAAAPTATGIASATTPTSGRWCPPTYATTSICFTAVGWQRSSSRT